MGLYEVLESAFKQVKKMFGTSKDKSKTNKSGADGSEGITTRFCQYKHRDMGYSHCLSCLYNHARVFETSLPKPPAGEYNHPKCHCKYYEVEERPAGSISKMGLNAPDVWLKAYGRLPDYYITKEEAISRYGWNSRRNTLAGKAPGKMIGGIIYQNKDEKLPVAEGRIWYECDVDYEVGTRSSKRLFYSNDGLMFYSKDHGEEHFVYIY